MFQPPPKKVKIEKDDVAKAKNPKETIIKIDEQLRLIPKRDFQHWCKIFFGELNKCDGYNLGKIILKLAVEEPNTHDKLESDFSNVNIVQRFPGLHSFRIQVEGLSADSKNIIELQVRREISGEDAASMLSSSRNSKRLPPKDNKYIESKHFTFAFQKLDIPPDLFGKPGKLETRKIFKIEFEKYDAIYKEITLQVKVYCTAIKGDLNYVEATAPNMTDAVSVLDYYFLNKRMESRTNFPPAKRQYRSSDDAQHFFALMREYHMYENRPNPEDSVQDPRMITQLLDYQKEAVVWMISREGVLEFSDDDNHSTEQLQKLLSMNINKRVSLKAFGGKSLDAYYSRTSGCISFEKQQIDKLPSSGGILADEMGLGKTIEMLSLILLNPRPDVTDLMNVSAINYDVKILSFECTCGTSDRRNENIVTCGNCGNSQHSGCLGFNETSGVQVLNKYVCPQCIAKLPPKPSKSTLIVVPNSILKQWEEEIENNISDNSLKLLIYRGFSNGKKYVHPDVMSQYDVVLTTYEVLRQEIHFTDLTEGKRLRDPKRYAALPCPMILVEWWRVCLDEAQMVENVSWSFSKMACMLPAVNRWCVSGTPITNSLQDLYGVVCFLGIEPITDIKLWGALIMEPFRLRNSQIAITTNLFGKIFWRTEKEYVQDQMRLPRQTEVIHRLEFVPAEKYFYDQRCMYWINEFKKGIENVERDQKISTLSNSQLLPFRRLRLICTHPQLDEEAFKAVDIFIEREAKLTLTVFEFVDWLIKRAVMSCQKQYKLQVVALNALAALHFIKHELEVAARQYGRVIELAEENKDRWKTDDVNLLHALINLSDIYQKLGRREHDPTLDNRVNKLIGKLVEKKTNELDIASSAILYKEINGSFGAKKDAWWIHVFIHIKFSTNAVQLFQELVQKLKKIIPFEFMTLKQPTVQPASDVFTFVANLQNMLQENLLEIFTKREDVFADWNKLILTSTIPTYLNVSVLECCHFSEPMHYNSYVIPSCSLCSFETKLSNYELLLNRPPQESEHVIEEVSVKSWTEMILDVIYQFAQNNQLPVSMLENGKCHIGQFCDLKNEILHFWKWFNKINERTTAIQSLLEVTKPITLNANSNTTVAATSYTPSLFRSEVTKPITLNANSNTTVAATSYTPSLFRSRLKSLSVVEPMQISPRIQLEITSLEIANLKFKDCLRDLQYLKGLQLYGYSSDSSVIELNPKTCAVDHPTQKWGFLPCGHFFCANCLSVTDNYEFSCSICSEKFFKQVIRFIDMQSSSKHTVTNIPSWEITKCKIWRNPFTKIEGVVRTLLTMQERHPNEKTLVICTCDVMLKVFAAEFHQNNISYIMYKTNRDALIRYRTDSTQVLLMPLTVASTGLNLTEANHVLLVEPIPNLAMEQQAIGRIHRLGQKKPTFVHRFYVADTIEEKLCRMNLDVENMTIQEMLDLFDK